MAKYPKVKVPRNWPKDCSGLSIARWNKAADYAVNQMLTKRELCDAVINDPFRAMLALQGVSVEDILKDNRYACIGHIEDIKKLKNLTRKKMEHLIAHERGHAKWRIKEVEEGNARLRQSVDSLNYELRQAREKIVELNRMIRAIRMLTETAKLDVMFGLGKKDDC